MLRSSANFGKHVRTALARIMPCICNTELLGRCLICSQQNLYSYTCLIYSSGIWKDTLSTIDRIWTIILSLFRAWIFGKKLLIRNSDITYQLDLSSDELKALLIFRRAQDSLHLQISSSLSSSSYEFKVRFLRIFE